jgi:hypothetical protein
MAAPSYTEDLTDFALAESSEGTAGTYWDEPSDSNWDDGGTETFDTDYPFLQGSYACTQQCTKASIAALMANNPLGGTPGSAITVPTDGAILVWQFFANSGSVDTYANGGFRVIIGNSFADFYGWSVGGVATGFYPYGGWQNHAVSPDVITPDYTAGSPTGSWSHAGAAVKSLAAIGKGNPHGVDAIRYGRCSSIFTNGDVSPNGPCTFAGFVAADESGSTRWGLARSLPGGYLWKGRMQLGTSGTAVYFVDANKSITWDEVPKASANFNLIEVNNASSQVDWTNVVHRCLSTQSPTRLLVNADADLNWDLCQFYNMGTLVFGGATGYCTNAKFQGCGQVSPKAANLSGSEFAGYEGTADTGYVNWDVSTDTDGLLDDCSFAKGTAATHAIEFDATNSPTAITLRGITFSGYTNSVGSSSAPIYVKRTSGTVTVSLYDCTGITTSGYKSAGATVSIIPASVTVRVTAKDIETLGNVENARVLLYADAGGDLPSGVSVSITGSGGTATVSHTGHGYSSGDKVWIQGANEQEYNGVFSITVTGADSYTYSYTGSPSSPATGTITATTVILDGLTNASGIVQDTSFIYTSDQPVLGRVRKGTSVPRYKTSPLADSITASGYLVTAYLIPDE